MRYVKWASSFCFCTTLLMQSNMAAAAKFQMMKPGEWNMEVLESSLGPLAKAVKPKPFCVDSKTNASNWEEKAKEDMRKAGLDCQLKLLKDEATLVSYDMDCKVNENAEKKNPILGPNTKFKGQVQLQRVSDTEYVMDQVANGTGMNLPKVDLSKLPEAQRKMLEATMGIKSDGGFQVTNKHRYTFATATCAKPAKDTAQAAPASTPALKTEEKTKTDDPGKK